MAGDDYKPPSTDLITLSRHVLNEGFKLQRQHQASGELTPVSYTHLTLPTKA